MVEAADNHWMLLATAVAAVAAVVSSIIAVIALGARPRLQAGTFVFKIEEPTAATSKGDYMISNVGNRAAEIVEHDVVVKIVPSGHPLGMVHPSRAKIDEGDPFWTRCDKPLPGTRQYEWIGGTKPHIDGVAAEKPAGSVSFVSFLKDSALTCDEVNEIRGGSLDVYIVGWFKYRAVWFPCNRAFFTRFCVKYCPSADAYLPAEITDWTGNT